MPTEQEKADLAKKRGQAAAQIADPEQRKKFIAAQGDAEASGKMTENKSAQMNKEADDTIATGGMNKEVGAPSYKKGTDRVPKTGMAKLHKDEAVLNKPAADKYRAALSGLGGSEMMEEQKPKKQLKEIRTRKAKSGGYIHEHHHTSPMDHPMEEHTSANVKDMLAHMQQHMTDEPEAQDNPVEEATE